MLKIERQAPEFTPYTITIDSEEDLNTFRRMVRDARYGVEEHGTIAGGDRSTDDMTAEILDTIGYN